MDKVQFNTEVVNMRKTVKTVKVLIVHSLTRQVKKLQSKKGSEQQVLKNQRRATKMLAEVEAIKDVPLDTFTKKAVTFKKGLQEVLNNPKSSALERVIARLIHHRLVQERVVKFEGMVTKDLLRTGTKKYRRLRKKNFEDEADARRKDEEDYQGRLELMIKAKKIRKEEKEEEEDAVSDEDDDEGRLEHMMKAKKISKKEEKEEEEEDVVSDEDDDEGSASDTSYDNRWEGFNTFLSETPHDETVHKLLNVEHNGNDGNSDDSIDPSNAKNHQSETVLHPEGGKQNKNIPTGPQTGNIGLNTLQGNEKEDLKQKNKRPLEKQSDLPPVMLHKTPMIAKSSSLQKTISTNKPRTVKQTPMVDKPNPVQQTQVEKLIPGINYFPDQAVRTGAPGKSFHKNTQSRPQSKQIHPSEWGNKPSHAKHPTSTSDIKLPQKIPTAKEQLHPSWEASKKRKLESKIVPFQGKKIVFDED
ncbi:serum response factor-binding protein 1-like [Asterias rubens]|uniref:serum response factor-binding protein 1-like n=1 Tax=Asterias rubens TaxID=7604 RepID=UPI0014559104|nr:serum response factor-binding protein 1-like [Asterias rubens]